MLIPEKKINELMARDKDRRILAAGGAKQFQH